MDDRRILNRWLEQTEIEGKGRVAAEVIAYYALQYLKDDISVEGRIRIKKLRNAASLLEKLVFTTRELDQKFYRDHINHMLKVAILARAIAKKKPFSLDEEELSSLVLACIFHDVAYPLSESARIFNKTLDSLKDCFSTAELFVNDLIKTSKVDVDSLALLTGEKPDRLKAALQEMNHGLLSAIELRAALKTDQSLEKYSNVIKAIALHDSDFRTKVDVISDPLLGLLIMTDELQDWGRPTDQGITIMPRIEDFEALDGHLRGVFKFQNCENFSVLRQISSKIANLGRLTIDPNQLRFEFRFDLQRLVQINHSCYEELLRMLFNSVDKELMDPSSNSDLSETAFFEKSYFGLEITSPVKQSLYDGLRNGKAESLLTNAKIYLNENLPEMILTDADISNIEAILLSNECSRSITARIVDGGSRVDGVIYSS